MTAVSDVIPGIFVGSSCLLVLDVSSGTFQSTPRNISNLGAVSIGATSIALRSPAGGNITMPPGVTLSFNDNTVGFRRVAVQLLNTVDTVINSAVDAPTSTTFSCAPVQYAIPNNRSAPWFDGIRPVRGLRSFNFTAEPKETELTGMDTFSGMVYGRNTTGVRASCEFIERPNDTGGGIILRAKDSGADNLANLWTMFVRSDGALDYGLGLFSSDGDPFTFDGYATHSFNVAFQANTFTSFDPQTYT